MKIRELVFYKCGKERGPEELLQGGERAGGGGDARKAEKG